MVAQQSDGSPGPSQPPKLTVAAVARRLGIAPSTLRTWDRRYGLGPTMHTSGSHRRYSEADIERLMEMRRLTLQGVPPADAAHSALEARRPEPLLELAPALISAEAGRAVATERPALPGARRGGGRVVAMAKAEPAARGLGRAAMALDHGEICRLVQEAISEQGVVRAWEQLVTPVLVSLGERWAATGTGIEIEHAFSESLLTVLRAVTGQVRRPRNPQPVLLACADGDQHTLPLHVLAAALAEEDVVCRLLGVGLPTADLAAAVRRCGPSAVLVFARLPVRQSMHDLGELTRQRPAPRLLIAGPGWGSAVAPPTVLRPASLAEAVDELVAAVAP